MRRVLLVAAVVGCLFLPSWVKVRESGQVRWLAAYGMTAAGSESTAERANRIHGQGWQEVLTKAAKDNAYRYALYASRCLAVVSPELYLQGDALFLQHISSKPGYAAAYQEGDSQSAKYTEGFSGPSFSWGLVDLKQFAVVPERDVYPSGVPFFDYLDARLGTVAVCLNAADRKVTALEMAALCYWAIPGGSAARKKAFLVYSSTHDAYLAKDGKLLTAGRGAAVTEISGKPILVFNEWSVWYPLMGRDDRGEDGALEKLVRQLRGDASCVPELSAFESSVMPELRTLSRMHSRLSALPPCTLSVDCPRTATSSNHW